jgi:hypothetical protein
MGLLTTAGAFAPAALAEEPGTTAAPTTAAPSPDAESTEAPVVLTPNPTTAAPVTTPAVTTPPATTPSATTPPEPSAPSTTTRSSAAPAAPTAAALPATPPAGAHFGTGKLHVGVVAADALPGGHWLDLDGAQLELTFSVVDGVPGQRTGTCTYMEGSCSFPPGTDLPGTNPLLGLPGVPSFLVHELPENSVFSLRLVTPPTSGQLLFDPLAKPALQGYTTTYGDPAAAGLTSWVALSVPHAYRPVGVTLAGGSPLSGATFELCTVPGSECTADGEAVVPATTGSTGTADFGGRYVPGDYTVVQTAAADGASFDAAPRTLTVPAARTVGERDTRVRLTLGAPVSTPVTPPVSTPVGTPAPTPPAVEEVAAETIVAGRQQTVALSGFQPGEEVRGVLRSTPVDLGTVVADANGVATFTFTVPAGVEAGTHTVTMTGLTSGVERKATFEVTEPAAPAGTGGLAYTGAEVVPLLALGGGLLAAGAAAVTVAGRRRSA